MEKCAIKINLMIVWIGNSRYCYISLGSDTITEPLLLEKLDAVVKASSQVSGLTESILTWRYWTLELLTALSQ